MTNTLQVKDWFGKILLARRTELYVVLVDEQNRTVGRRLCITVNEDGLRCTEELD